MTAPSLRRATSADLVAIERLMADFARETNWPPRGVHADLRDGIADIRVWIAEDETGAVGFAVSVPGLDLGVGRGCWLSDLYVDPRVRRRGVARALVAQVVSEALSHGERWMEWHADADNPGAHRFYESIGGVSKPRHLVFGLDEPALRALRDRGQG